MRRWQPQDQYFHQAKKEGYSARSIYKLEEIDRRVGLLGPGKRVLDLGCHPGSWLQYCARMVGEHGLVVGVDTRRISLKLPSHVRFLQADIFELLPTELHQFTTGFDVVLSDLAPATSGIRSTDSARSIQLLGQALRLADALLVPGGHFAGKVFQGFGYGEIVQEIRGRFGKLRGIKPRASRKQSKEIYLVALEKKG